MRNKREFQQTVTKEEEKEKRKEKNLVDFDAIHTCPGDSVRGNNGGKELGNISDAVGLEEVDVFILLLKEAGVVALPVFANLAETLPNQRVEAHKSPFLTTTLNDHQGQLAFMLLTRVKLQELARVEKSKQGTLRQRHEGLCVRVRANLVAALLMVDRGHDGQIDLTPELNHAGAGLVLDQGSLGLPDCLVALLPFIFVITIFFA